MVVFLSLTTVPLSKSPSPDVIYTIYESGLAEVSRESIVSSQERTALPYESIRTLNLCGASGWITAFLLCLAARYLTTLLYTERESVNLKLGS